jgi:hypothetical protein
MEEMVQLFQEFYTPQEKKFVTEAKKMYLDAVLGNGKMMKELAAFGARSGPALNPDHLRKEIERNRNPEEAIRMKSVFNTLWDIQKREIEESMAVTASPHGLIVDPVWRDTLSFCITHTSPLSLGYLRTLDGHGGWLFSPCHNISNRRH